tara:strand:+ start:80 stop:547 length:468 start_codon:yes stop_codon:yes gene_type:complete
LRNKLLSLLLIFTPYCLSDTSEQLNTFFDNELFFIQTSINKLNNNVDESKGTYMKNDDKSIVIEINSPFREKYYINDNEIKIHDLDFNQIKKISINDINESMLINLLIDGFPKNFNNQINIKERVFFIDFINENTVQIKFKDNMQIDNIIEFYKK